MLCFSMRCSEPMLPAGAVFRKNPLKVVHLGARVSLTPASAAAASAALAGRRAACPAGGVTAAAVSCMQS